MQPPAKYQTTLWKQVQGLPDVFRALGELAAILLRLARDERSAITAMENEAPAPAPGPSGTPAGLTMLYVGNTCPSGYSEDTAYLERIPRGADVTYPLGTTGGVTGHTHTTNPVTSTASIFDDGAEATSGVGDTALPRAHEHALQTADSTGTFPDPHYPWYRAFVFCKRDA